MRTSILPSMVKVIVNNLNKKNLSGRLFEFAKEYIAEELIKEYGLNQIKKKEQSLLLIMVVE